MTPDEALREIERRDELLAGADHRNAELEAQAAALREALEAVEWVTLEPDELPGCPFCRRTGPCWDAQGNKEGGVHEPDCHVAAALASDAGRQLLERLRKAEAKS